MLNKARRNRFFFVPFVLLFSIAMLGCGDDPPPEDPPSPIIGAWDTGVATVTFKNDSTFEISTGVTGTYTLSGNKITFVGSGSSSCGTTPGIYTFSFNTAKDQVTFALVEDSCVGRKDGTAGKTWTKVDASPTFSALTQSLTTSRADHTATRLSDGKVLITGGFSSSTFPAPALNTAELYDPATDTFSAITNTMQSDRIGHTATLLSNGQVLLTGGQVNNNDGDGSNTAELYDPATQTFTAIADTMVSPRGGHTATLLSDGKVLLAGGFNGGPGTLISDAELYDPTTQIFTALTATMASIRNEHTATLLPDGKVLLAGGNDSNVSIAELYDPRAQTFTAITATMTSPRAAHTATLLSDGKVLLTGGGSNFSQTNPSSSGILNTAELYDPTAQTFTAITATMASHRFAHAATLLGNGSVLLTGGVNVPNNSFIPLDTAEVYRP